MIYRQEKRVMFLTHCSSRDDLVAFFPFGKTGAVKNKVKNYIKEIEVWLEKWRLTMAPSKCNYTIFAKSNINLEKTKDEFDLRMYDEVIPYEANPVSLGITFDEKLNFEAHVKKIREKCQKRSNLVKIMSHKSWHLSKKTLLTLYKAVVGSVLDYSAFIVPRLSERLKTTLQAIQNKAVRTIFRQSFRAKTAHLCSLSSLILVEDRMKGLNEKYLKKALSSNNELIFDLFKQYLDGKFEGPGMSEREKSSTLLHGHTHMYTHV